MLRKSERYWHVIPNPKSLQNPASFLWIYFTTNELFTIIILKSAPKTSADIKVNVEVKNKI